MNVIPGQDPSDGPNYFTFDDAVLYAINIDNDRDGKAEDVVYEFRFKTENRPGPGGLTSPAVSRQSAYSCGGWAAGHYRPGRSRLGRTDAAPDLHRDRGARRYAARAVQRAHARGRPIQCGPATMPNYPALAAQGIYTDASTRHPRVRRTARRDLLHRPGCGVRHLEPAPLPPDPLTGPGEDTDTVNPFGVNRFSGSNVNTIAIEVPIKAITSDGKPAATAKHPVIGMYASAARQRTKELGRDGEVTTRWTVGPGVANGQPPGERADHHHPVQRTSGTRPSRRRRPASRPSTGTP